MTFVTVWGTWEYCGKGKALVVVNHDLDAATKYFDWNRN
jgi:hypothetical protein